MLETAPRYYIRNSTVDEGNDMCRIGSNIFSIIRFRVSILGIIPARTYYT